MVAGGDQRRGLKRAKVLGREMVRNEGRDKEFVMEMELHGELVEGCEQRGHV